MHFDFFLFGNICYNIILIRLILTAIDQLDLYEFKAVRSIFLSRDAKLKVESAKIRFDLQDNQILPIANYVDGTHQDIYRDVLTLQAVENILQEALVFLEDKPDAGRITTLFQR